MMLHFFSILTGLAVGSFLNMAVSRLPQMLEREWNAAARSQLKLPEPAESVKPFNLARPRSHCPHCKTALRWSDNLPLLGWLRQGGRCRHCGSAIAWRYPLLEILTAAAFVSQSVQHGWSLSTLGGCVLAAFLLAAAAVDAETGLLPDMLTLPLLWLGLLFQITIGGDLAGAVIGAVAAYLFLWLANACFKRLRGMDGMGGGDFKLFAAIGAWLGWGALPSVLFAACTSGLLAVVLLPKLRGKPLYFGPYLAASAWLLWLFPEIQAVWQF